MVENSLLKPSNAELIRQGSFDSFRHTGDINDTPVSFSSKGREFMPMTIPRGEKVRTHKKLLSPSPNPSSKKVDYSYFSQTFKDQKPPKSLF